MDKVTKNIPFIVMILCMILISSGTYYGIKTILRIFTTPLPIQAWPLIAGGFLGSFINACLTVVAGFAIYTKKRWGWWLAGIIAMSGLIGSVLSSVQLFAFRPNGIPMYKVSPNILQDTILSYCIAVLLIYLVFNITTRKHLLGDNCNIKDCLVKTFAFGLLLYLFTISVVFASSWLNVYVNQ